ncbi:MAG: endonuclease/exonuclease/phosphatase family protein [Ruminococcus sp.]|nr:endonuclease/exonuclease/phosphatase family protein [Ruminococcus sp.]
MKLMTLNTHSLVEEHYSEKLESFVQAVSEEQPDIIALQEVNQTITEMPVKIAQGYIPCAEGITIRQDNHIYHATEMLKSRGICYFWTWLPLKKGYDKYDEGIALMSRSPILETKIVQTSAINDYNNWKTRKILGIRTEATPEEWFFSVHYGWWDDPDETFQGQWQRTKDALTDHSRMWLMGDFNSPAEVRGEGYDMIRQDGWHDCYLLAEEKDCGITVGHIIDGWKDKITDTNGMRIDQIWCSEKRKIISSEIIFNGTNRSIVSDHYGVIVNYERSKG